MKYLSLIFLILLASCAATATPNRQKLEELGYVYAEVGNSNDDKMFDGQELALHNGKEKVIALELELDIADAQKKAAAYADPVAGAKYLSTEVARLYAKADQRRAEFATAQATFRRLHDQNVATNRAATAKIKAALKTQAPPMPQDLSGEIRVTTGAQSVKPATLIEP